MNHKNGRPKSRQRRNQRHDRGLRKVRIGVARKLQPERVRARAFEALR